LKPIAAQGEHRRCRASMGPAQGWEPALASSFQAHDVAVFEHRGVECGNARADLADAFAALVGRDDDLAHAGLVTCGLIGCSECGVGDACKANGSRCCQNGCAGMSSCTLSIKLLFF